MSLMNFFSPAKSTPERSGTSLSDSLSDTPQSVDTIESTINVTAECSADAEPKTETPTVTPVVCSKMCIGSSIVPTCTANDHKTTVEYDITDGGEDRFIVLDSRASRWLYVGLGHNASKLTQRKTILSLKTVRSLKAGIQNHFTKRTSRNWRLGDGGQPISKTSTISISVNGTTIDCLPNRKKLLVKATSASLNSLFKCINDDLTAGSSDDDEEADNEGIFSSETISEFKANGINYQPSRNRLNIKNSDSSIKTWVNIQIKQRLKTKISEDEFQAHVKKAARKAEKQALAIASGAAEDAAQVSDASVATTDESD